MTATLDLTRTQPTGRSTGLTARRHAGATIWFTGLPAAGKTTIAAAVARRLADTGRPAYVLDGDVLRSGLNSDLGFDPDDRSENIRRVAHVARLFADAGTVALVSVISPYTSDRRLARILHEVDGLPFAETYVSTPLRECERRDPKGLYARARAGDLHGFTGVDAPYEVPSAPELILDHRLSVADAAERVMAWLAPTCD